MMSFEFIEKGKITFLKNLDLTVRVSDEYLSMGIFESIDRGIDLIEENWFRILSIPCKQASTNTSNHN